MLTWLMLRCGDDDEKDEASVFVNVKFTLLKLVNPLNLVIMTYFMSVIM